MNYCTIDDLQRDELLKSVVSSDDIVEATEYIKDLAYSLSVDPIMISNTEIPYKVKQLAINYALMTASKNKSRMNQKGQDGVDAYELKRKVYAAKVDEFTREIKLSPVILTGKKPKSSAFKTIELSRR